MLENKLTLDYLEEGFPLFKLAFDFFYDMTPSTMWAVKLKQMMEEGLVPHRNSFREVKKHKCPMETTMYFYKVTLSVPASPISPFSATISATSSATATLETARPTSPISPLRKQFWWRPLWRSHLITVNDHVAQLINLCVVYVMCVSVFLWKANSSTARTGEVSNCIT